ncbi:MAG: hypothetical protein KIT02_08345 [Devosia sp.]|uniref:hypothetical protein n=1 Tax=Devosia sp. TaxID=1871048 RepID=UPI0024CC8281|nr:hypothetical protein [Devosia sp.]UYO01194.1 MAG: hypothetical protein KIT02_08345 [Devosia sp.]
MTTVTARIPRGFAVFPKRLLAEQGLFTVMIWGAFSVLMLVIPVVVSFFRPIEVSGWVIGLGIVQWYVLAIGCYVGGQYLELHVAHGQSRRSYLKSAFIFVPLFAAMVAALCIVTFFPEALIYHLAGWPQAVDGSHLYDHPLEVHLVFLHYWLIFTLYGAGGLFLGVAWYRGAYIGSLAIPFAVALSLIASVGMANRDGPLQFLVQEGLVPTEPNAWLATALHLLCVAVLFAVTWLCGRNVAIKKKAV